MSIQEMRAALAQAHDDAINLASQYAGDFYSLFSSVASIFALVFNNYERSVSARMENMIAQMQANIDGFTGRVREDYQTDMNDNLAQLKKRLRAAHFLGQRALADVERRSRDLRIRLQELRAGINRQKVAMAGDENASIKMPSTGWRRVAAELIGYVSANAGVMSIEYLLGFAIWQDVSDPTTALGLSLITVFGFTFLVRITMINMKRLAAHRDAVKNFGMRYQQGHGDGFVVSQFPTAEKRIAHIGMATLIFMATLLLGSRLWIVLGGRSDFSGMAGSIGLLFVLVVYALFEYLLTLPYKTEQYAELRKVLDEQDELMAQLRPVDAQAVYKEEATKAFALYGKECDEADDAVSESFDDAVTLRDDLVKMFNDYSHVFELCKAGFVNACNALMSAVVVQFGLDTSKIEKLDSGRVVDAFTRKIALAYNRPEFVQQIARHEFVVDNPDLRLTDFSEVEDEVLRNLAPPRIDA